MTSPPEEITITCPKCGETYKDWYTPSINLMLDDVDDDDDEKGGGDSGRAGNCRTCAGADSHCNTFVGQQVHLPPADVLAIVHCVAIQYAGAARARVFPAAQRVGNPSIQNTLKL